MTTADGATLTFTYDAFGRVTRELHQQGGVTLKDLGGASGTVLDSLGRPESQTEAVAAITHSWTYPQDAASGTQETINYDATPLTSLAVARNGREVETSRTVTIAAGVTVILTVSDSSAGRDTADRWKQRTIQRSGYTAKTQNRAFDDAGRLTSQSGLGFSSAGTYAYDANSGQKTAESLPLALGGTLAGSYTYYPGGSLAVATTNGLEESFTYDEVGNLVTDVVSDAQATVYSYDDPATQGDDGDNRLYSTTTTADTDGASPVTTYYGWDSANAWRTCQGPNPSPTQANSPVDLSYNALGRMSAYANSDANTSATYAYDAAGQRTKSTVTVGGVTTTTTFAYDDGTLLSLSAAQGSVTWRLDYLCDEDDSAWGGVYRSPATSTSPTYFSLITSDRGDVVELCDANGTAFCAYRYDAWGLPQGAGTYATGVWTQATTLVTAALAGEIASRQVLRYACYAWDSESSLYYCSARYYDPATRQWTTGDPAKADGEESAYQYCAGEPVGRVDPSGLHAVKRSFNWDGASHGHPNWKATLVVRATYEEKADDNTDTIFYRIKKIGGKITNKKGAFYVIGHMRGDEAGRPWDIFNDVYWVRWPLANGVWTYETIPDMRSMSEDVWYYKQPNWQGSPWHCNESSGLTPAPREVGAVRFYMYKNSNGDNFTNRRVAVDVFDDLD